ncbi:MAG: 16S rRNA (guanine(966)-N(2))-methyltransferase RsmD [Clostridiaceae bacterium]|nr:16S rRNA (guanine(966)-N(2))-methyltransferase RsmD [Clostridiaceae bacterium]
MPRIIAGEARGIQLITPHGDKTRPTSDKAKEALFSILMPRLQEARFLDIFAGSGQIGLEAVSRGAAQAVLIEQASPALRAISQNMEKTRLGDRISLMKGSASSCLRQLVDNNRKFDLIYLDPPWQQAIQDFVKLSGLLSELIDDQGMIILEHESRIMPDDHVTKLKCWRHCQYGAAMLSFYHLNKQE